MTTKSDLLIASAWSVAVALLAAAAPVSAQTLSNGTSGDPAPAQEVDPAATTPGQVGQIPDIIVTAQRTAERLQDVPIAVSAFNAEALEKQQIKNPLDLQLTLPNVQLTKTNFTASSSFTIRGIGDLCVGTTCDAATAIHLNDEPLFFSPFFQTEFYDVERIEVLRGPQGTLFGRNATAGVVNVTTAKPDLSRIAAAAEAEYGNYNSIKGKAMINLPIGRMIGIRVAGLYLNRDGYTRNLYNNSRVDDRDLYSVRGTLRFQPSSSTTLDLIGSYFREDDKRLRIQKSLCARDPTGVLGCLPDRLGYGTVNTNAVFAPGDVPSREFLGIALANPALGQAFGLGSIYGPDAGAGVNPADPRTINSDYPVRYFNEELIAQAKLNQSIGQFNLSLSGTYQDTKVDSQEDYLFGLSNRATAQPGINSLAAAAAGLIPGLPAAYFKPAADALIPQGPAGPLCVSDAETTGLGAFGGSKQCYDTPRDFDRSRQSQKAYSIEGIVSSDLDGPFNFLVGGIYSNYHVDNNDYYVNSFYIDYTSGVLGAFQALGRTAAGLPTPPSFLATPYFRNNTADYRLKSYGLFGEGYLQISDKLKLTGGIRYNNDRKTVVARSSLLTTNFLVPFGSPSAYDQPLFGGVDFDPGIPGNQPFQVRRVKFGKFTGRAVVDYQITPNNLLYASYSRGYKSGGINPPLQPIFDVSDTFAPEFINAYEIGSKNTFANGRMTLNLTGFYYKYKDLQLSRIVARTAVNDNVNAEIYGLEAEAIVRPIRAVAVNLGASYLHSKVSSDKLLSNPRDPSGGRADAVIIKDLSNGSNCAITSNVGSAAAAQGFVTAVNSALGLRGPTGFGPNSTLQATGAFGICSALQANTASPAAAALGGFTFQPSGVPVNIKGNALPQAPKYKFSAGAQYTADLGGFTLVPRVDLAYTGEFQASIFNTRPVDKVAGYAVLNAQIQLNAPGDRFFVRGFIQNITDNNAITGQYVGDASSGLYTNAFLLEPRRYGIAAGVKF